jgi:RNA polymerase sigma factor (sigma-70 family)
VSGATLKRTGLSTAGPVRLLTETALARRAAAGSEAAFAEIFRRHHQPLFRYALSILGNDDDARDVVQQTMLALLRSLPGDDRQIALRPWLFRIAHNEAISLRRRRTDAPLESVPEPADDALDASTRLRAHVLIADLAGLPDRQRSAIVMRELNGMSHAEIGVALGVSPEAAKQTVYEARCALQEQEEGREMTCDDARRTISAHDRRRLRGRKLRAHLRSCSSCRSFEETISRRSAELAAVGFLPAAPAAELLASVLGSGGGAGGGGGGLLGGGVAALHAAAGGGATKMLAGAVTAIVAATALSVEAIRWTSSERADGRVPTESVVPATPGIEGGSASTIAATTGKHAVAAGRRPAKVRAKGSKASRAGDTRGRSNGKPDGPRGPDGAGPPGAGGQGKGNGPPPGAVPPHAGGPHAGGPPPGGPPSSPPGRDTASGKKPILPLPVPNGKAPPLPSGLDGKDNPLKSPSLPE